MLSIFGGHFMDVLFHTVGSPSKLTAVEEKQFPYLKVLETGEQLPNATPDAGLVLGTLAEGGLFAVQIEGGQPHPTGLQLDITGTEGVLRMTNSLAPGDKQGNTIAGMKGDAQAFAPLPVPAAYHTFAGTHLSASAPELAYLYAAYAHDRRHGTAEASSFADALRLHRLFDQLEQTSSRLA